MFIDNIAYVLLPFCFYIMIIANYCLCVAFVLPHICFIFVGQVIMGGFGGFDQGTLTLS